MPLSLTDVWDLGRSYADRAGKTSSKARWHGRPPARRARSLRANVGPHQLFLYSWRAALERYCRYGSWFMRVLIFPAPNRRFFCLATDELIERRPIGIICGCLIH